MVPQKGKPLDDVEVVVVVVVVVGVEVGVGPPKGVLSPRKPGGRFNASRIRSYNRNMVSAAITVAALLLSCGPPPERPAAALPDLPACPQCQRSSDCQGRQLCIRGECKRYGRGTHGPVSCQTSEDCGDGQVCFRNACGVLWTD